MNQSIHGSFTRAIQFTHIKFRDALINIWANIHCAISAASEIAKKLYIDFIQLLPNKKIAFPYLIMGVGTFALITAGWSLIKKFRGNKSSNKLKQKKQKGSQTEEELESTYQSLQQGGHKSEDSMMSIRLPLDAILEADSEDDHEDRLFFQVIKNYRHT